MNSFSPIILFTRSPIEIIPTSFFPSSTGRWRTRLSVISAMHCSTDCSGRNSPRSERPVQDARLQAELDAWRTRRPPQSSCCLPREWRRPRKPDRVAFSGRTCAKRPRLARVIICSRLRTLGRISVLSLPQEGALHQGAEVMPAALPRRERERPLLEGWSMRTVPSQGPGSFPWCPCGAAPKLPKFAASITVRPTPPAFSPPSGWGQGPKGNFGNHLCLGSPQMVGGPHALDVTAQGGISPTPVRRGRSG